MKKLRNAWLERTLAIDQPKVGVFHLLNDIIERRNRKPEWHKGRKSGRCAQK